MILVIVGTNYFPFDRLLKYVDEQLAPNYKVIMQLGVSKYQPKYSKYQRFFTENEVDILLDRCSVVICHGGYGVITNALMKKKKIVVVPRIAKLNECLDDQFELCRYLSGLGIIKMVEEINDLEKIIMDLNEFHPVFDYSETEQSLDGAYQIVDNYLRSILK